MIRLTGLVNLKSVGSLKNEAELTSAQKKLDVDKDGKIEGEDLAKLRASKNEGHGEDHEVSMAHNSLDNLIKNAMELKMKMGEGEKNIPAWIQDHIAVAANNLEQAATNYHEYDTPESSPVEGMCEGEGCEEQISEKAPEGWEGTVKAMKDKPEIDNPWALAYYMKKKGYKSHKKEK